jgi:hypothetical protein
MEARLLLSGTDNPHDELSSLRQRLADKPEFRDRVRTEQAPGPGRPDAWVHRSPQRALTCGGTLTVLAGSVSVWLRGRRSQLASAPPNKQSLSPPGGPHAAFTGALLAVLTDGLPETQPGVAAQIYPPPRLLRPT